MNRIFLIFLIGIIHCINIKSDTLSTNLNIKNRNPDIKSKPNKSTIQWSLAAAAKLGKYAVISPLNVASRIVRKPIRDVSFWGKALTIYGSYKVHQVKTRVRDSLTLRKGKKWHALHQNRTDAMWNYIHEENSKRMVNLCLGMKGFYLKTGQFLGTRHDFMPKHYTVNSIK